MSFDREPFDVAVIGAGAAGLAAARDLSAAGLSVAVIEARERIGGRIDTRRDPAFPFPIELGAEFVHGRPAETGEIIRAADLAACDVSGDHRWARDGRIDRPADLRVGLGEVMGRLERVGPEDMTFARFLEVHCADVAEEVRAMAVSFVEGYDAAPADRASARALAEEEREGEAIGEDETSRVLGGYDGIVRWLAAGLDPRRSAVLLGGPAVVVRWAEGEVAVERRGTFGSPPAVRAARAVVALPLGVLGARPGEAGAVRFDPEIPGTRAAAGRLAMGSAVKVVLRFREAFWQEEGRAAGPDVRSLSFLHSADPSFPTWWTTYPVRSPVLTAWAGGPAAERLAGKGRAAVIAEAVAALGRLLGIPRPRIEGRLAAARLHDWQADPFSRGAYSYVPAGGLGAREELARPAGGTLFFAGEATRPGGTVAAAIASGRRAAREVLAIRAPRP